MCNEHLFKYCINVTVWSYLWKDTFYCIELKCIKWKHCWYVILKLCESNKCAQLESQSSWIQVCDKLNKAEMNDTKLIRNLQ